MTDDTPTTETPTPPDEEVLIGEPPPEDPEDGVIPGADTDGYVNDDSPDNPDADGGDDEEKP